MLAIKMIPKDVLMESRAKSRELTVPYFPRSKTGLFIVILIWLIGLTALIIVAAGGCLFSR